MLDLGLKIVAAYLLGSVMGGLILRSLVGGADIRQEGSGNAGATNALRTRGKGFGAAVALVDVVKGAVAAGLLPLIALPGLEPATELVGGWVPALCAMAAVFGHIWPIWHGFRGGKGAATLVGTLIVIEPMALLPVFGVWILCLILTGYVGLATVLAAVAAPVYALFVGGVESILFTFAGVMCLTIIYTHRSNLQRLARGTEARFDSVMLFRKAK